MGYITAQEAEFRLKKSQENRAVITASTTDLLYIPGVNNIEGRYQQAFFRIHPSIFLQNNLSNLALKILNVVTSNQFYADYSFTIILSDTNLENFYLWRGHQFSRLFNSHPNHNDHTWSILEKSELVNFLRNITFNPSHVLEENDISSNLQVHAILEVIVQTVSRIKVEKRFFFLGNLRICRLLF